MRVAHLSSRRTSRRFLMISGSTLISIISPEVGAMDESYDRGEEEEEEEEEIGERSPRGKIKRML